MFVQVIFNESDKYFPQSNQNATTDYLFDFQLLHIHISILFVFMYENYGN